MSRRLAPHAHVSILALATIAGCVFGFRGEVEFAGDASLAGIDTVQLHLPATELTLVGDPLRSTIDWRGTWSTLGGSANDALAGGNRADLRWERWEQIGRLSADLSPDLRDITSLDELTVESASDRAHEIVGTGDVFITGIDDYIAV
ncbi:MAG: hypothetical protein KC457_34505, partial [Myxococcales bacterium]|nr:hypothetical protein [Myxococcales bacterium]